MRPHSTDGAAAPGSTAPDAAAHKDETPGRQGREGFGDQENRDGHFRGAGAADQAADAAAEGAGFAHAYLARLRAGTTEPGELAVILAFLDGALLQGACGVIESALGVRHG